MLKLSPMEWNNPQICGDCREMATVGYQELKRSPGGPYIEKRCRPCAVKHYGEAELKQLGAPTKKKTAGHKSGDMETTEATLLD